jgi:hypothetical protein
MATRTNSKIHSRTRKFATLGLLIPLLAFGECYQESVTSSNSKADIREIADLQKLVKSVGNQQVCTILFKAKINNRWHDARGESQGSVTDSTDQICSQALHIGRTRVLEKVVGSSVQSSQSLYCNDFNIPQLKKGLKKFDTFKISELKPVPNAEPFEYKGSVCRYFLESDIDPSTNNLMQWQIVGCVIRNEWTVIDKF